MAQREALRELQTRLAQRLAQAKGEVRVVSWLAVECAGVGLLFPLAGAGEIFPVDVLLPVPHTQAWFAGVANLRGGLHSAIDLALFLGLQVLPSPREGASLVALNPNLGSHSALLVQRLVGLRNAEQLQAQAPDGVLRPTFAAARWRDAAGRIWQEIDLAALAKHEQFLAIASQTQTQHKPIAGH